MSSSHRYGGATTTGSNSNTTTKNNNNNNNNNNIYTFSPSAAYNPEVNESKRQLVIMDPKRRNHEYSSSTSYAPTKNDNDDDDDDYDAANYDAMPLEDQRRVALEESEDAATARNTNDIPFLLTRNGILTMIIVGLLIVGVIVGLVVITRRGSAESKAITGFPTFSPISIPTVMPSKFFIYRYCMNYLVRLDFRVFHDFSHKFDLFKQQQHSHDSITYYNFTANVQSITIL
jgi:hypothetical protein